MPEPVYYYSSFFWVSCPPPVEWQHDLLWPKYYVVMYYSFWCSFAGSLSVLFVLRSTVLHISQWLIMTHGSSSSCDCGAAHAAGYGIDCFIKINTRYKKRFFFRVRSWSMYILCAFWTCGSTFASNHNNNIYAEWRKCRIHSAGHENWAWPRLQPNIRFQVSNTTRAAIVPGTIRTTTE